MVWKLLKDKIVLDRVRDAAFHDAAIEEIASGVRRQGLWAKALIEAHGDERTAKMVYVKLLVVALKDEAYIADRVRKNSPPPVPRATPQPPPQPSDRPERTGFTSEQLEQMRRYGVTHNGKYYACGEMHFDRYSDAISYAAYQQKRPKA